MTSIPASSAAVPRTTPRRGILDPRDYHPLPNLLHMSATEILAAYRNSQLHDFTTAIRRLRDGGRELTASIDILTRYLQAYPSESFQRRMRLETIEHLFREMHEHVMAHPVWVHPFFVRVTEGNLTSEQLRRFARHYFNQVKNTRQCVALALGRFHTMIDRPDGPVLTVLSELTQLVLAGLLSDEYGTTAHGHDSHAENGGPSVPNIDIGQLFCPVTHPELFRRFLGALGDTAVDYDVPMLHGVADNVLVQRILSSDPAFDELEALASVGLGMEWGVPAFFSMIIAGVLKIAQRESLSLDHESMEIWVAHVRQDVEHAVAVMVATAFYVDGMADARRIEGATNILMAFRYDMMSDIYREVFGAPCANIADIELSSRYLIHDRRIDPLLRQARTRVRPSSVQGYDAYLRSDFAFSRRTGAAGS